MDGFPGRRLAAAVAAAASVLGLGGCVSSEQDRAISSAQEFVGAMQVGDGVAACEVLAPATIEQLEQSSDSVCTDAVLDHVVEVGAQVDASTYGSMAQVRFAKDVVFLAEFDDRWRVVAAGCSARPSGPYECAIQGR